MSAALTLATSDHLDALLALVERFHDEEGIDSTPDSRHAGVAPLLDGIPHGAAYLIGPPRAPIGYIIICFGWSVEFAGMDGFVDELYIRPGVRGRGVATEVLMALPRALAQGGLKALHLEVDTTNDTARRLYKRAGFKMRDGYHLMTQML
ncbi:GNAT family N-acetyltransferase [Pseudosulfitobacter sp. DSM 107133]|uniref:GNAT family N-acetyltransferase n=1 Tax=Pseudosulfitobacter sp. DSM 107133 TaxID=2883100 RepID=UPI000DF127CE|nr:GNAT family N-acetyltransferase [Pseudosulfitobacter sp. DSM 107133]UOA27076.1 Mycothiol acetyltransferase [Pseudosulfitobacter sp. DSM 107133]